MPKLLTEAWARTQFRGKMLYDSQWYGDFQVTIPMGGDQIWFYYSLNEIKCKVSIKEVTLIVLTTFFQLVSESLKAHMVGFSFLQEKVGIFKLMARAKSDLLQNLLFQGTQLQNSDCIEVAQSMRASNLDLGGAI